MKSFDTLGSFIEHIGNTMHEMTNGSILGNIAIGAGAALTSFFAPIAGLIVTCFVLTFADMLYGIGVAKKQHKKITSFKNWKGTLRKLQHELVLLGLARLIEFTILGSSGVFVLTGGITVIISLTELWSIIENLNTLYPHGPWKILGAFLKKKGEEYVGMELELDKHGHNDDTQLSSKA